MKASLAVFDSPGIFSTERYCTFDAGGQVYGLFVDESHVWDGRMDVAVVAGEMGDELLIDLPAETWTTGNRILVPRELVRIGEGDDD